MMFTSSTRSVEYESFFVDVLGKTSYCSFLSVKQESSLKMVRKCFFCVKCDKAFASNHSYKRHVRNNVCDRVPLGGIRRGRQQRHAEAQSESLRAETGTSAEQLACSDCDRVFTRRRNLLNHRQRYHMNVRIRYPCGFCQQSFLSANELDSHRTRAHQSRNSFYERASALRRSCQVFRLDMPRRIVSVNGVIQYSTGQAVNFLEQKQIELNVFKVCLCLGAEYEKMGEDQAEGELAERMLMNFRSKTQTIMPFNDTESTVARCLNEIESHSEQFSVNGSGWVLDRVLYLDIEIGQCYQLSGSCTLHQLLDQRGSNDVLQVQRNDAWPITEPEVFNDGECFFYAVAAYFCEKNASVETLNAFISTHLVKCIDAPVKVTDIEKFEKANVHLSFALNVIYKNESEEIFPVYISKNESNDHIINLLLFHLADVSQVNYPRCELEMSDHSSDEEDCVELNAFDHKHVLEYEERGEILPDPCVKHYALIEDLEKAIVKGKILQLKKQIRDLMKKKGKILRSLSKMEDKTRTDYVREESLKRELKILEKEHESLASEYKKNNRYDRSRVCYNCFCIFTDSKGLKRHREWCFKQEPGQVIIASETEKDEFELKRKHVKSPVQIFFDFEAIQAKPERACACPSNSSDLSTDCTHNTKVEFEQLPFAYCIIGVRNKEDAESEDGDGRQVLDVIDYIGNDAAERFLNDILDLEEKYIRYIREAKPMIISDEEQKMFEEATHCHICEKEILACQKKCRDHCHKSGQYLGAAHNVCNLQRQDADVTIPAFCHNFIGYDSHFIMSNIHKVIGRVHTLSAIPLNSEKFKQVRLNRIIMKDSMSFMDGSLEKLTDTLVKSRHEFNILKEVFSSEKRQKLVLRKGVYPYEYCTSVELLEKTKQLPALECFYSTLSNSSVSKEDYNHAKIVWKEFDCANMLDYTRLYVVSDAVLLAEVIQRFREMILNDFGLDPCHFISLPSLSKDIMLKTGNVRLDLISDLDMIYFFKNNIRGGLSYVATRYADVDKLEEKTGEKHSLLYVDANSLYGGAMSHKLPLGDYRWLTGIYIAVSLTYAYNHTFFFR